jgi:hypothetical protein
VARRCEERSWSSASLSESCKKERWGSTVAGGSNGELETGSSVDEARTLAKVYEVEDA